MTDSFIDAPAEPAENHHQLIAAIILGIAATLTAVSSYMSAVVDGDAQVARSDSVRSLTDANFFYSQANQTSAGDQELFVSFATAAQAGDQELAEYLQTLMRPEMVEALEWWQANDEAVTPFDELEGNPYTLADLDAAQGLEQQSLEEVQTAEDADAKGDKYDLSTVLLALTLFFAGIATLFASDRVTVALLAVGAVTLVAGSGILLQGLTL